LSGGLGLGLDINIERVEEIISSIRKLEEAVSKDEGND